MRCHAYRLRLNFWLEATTTRTKEDQTRVVGKKKMAEEVEQLNTTRKYVGDTVTSNQSLSHCVTWIQNCDKNFQMISIIYVEVSTITAISYTRNCNFCQKQNIRLGL